MNSWYTAMTSDQWKRAQWGTPNDKLKISQLPMWENAYKTSTKSLPFLGQRLCFCYQPPTSLWLLISDKTGNHQESRTQVKFVGIKLLGSRATCLWSFLHSGYQWIHMLEVGRQDNHKGKFNSWKKLMKDRSNHSGWKNDFILKLMNTSIYLQYGLLPLL